MALAAASSVEPDFDELDSTELIEVSRIEPLDPKSIGGIKRLRYLLPLLKPLHLVGCERDSAGNRELHFDEYVTLVLLYMLNPMLNSVQMLQQASSLEKISDKLGVKRFNIGSFSESVRVFDPQKLKEVVIQLAKEL